ncbi:hypothetical protein Vretimale_4783 [Volvox reticuliferus]|uniref:sn-1-specific diacylglycerol lipase n=1 Tax=Volvox reticuliferus TaxID=1737510 RepID=A0A8J4G537_9CHLO|nr:hypothetical protein Vretimale_4783 [Volvox reticuliferus]
MILVAAAQRERRRRALRDAMVAAAAAHSVLLGSSGSVAAWQGFGSASVLKPAHGSHSDTVSACGGPCKNVRSPGFSGDGTSVCSLGNEGQPTPAWGRPSLLHGGEEGQVQETTPSRGNVSPFLAVQEPVLPLPLPLPLPPPPPPPPPPPAPLPPAPGPGPQQQQHIWQQGGRQPPRVHISEVGTELAPVHVPPASASRGILAEAYAPYGTGNTEAGIEGSRAALDATGWGMPTRLTTHAALSQAGYSFRNATINTTSTSAGGGGADVVGSSTLLADNIGTNASSSGQPVLSAETYPCLSSGGGGSRLSLLGVEITDTAAAAAAAATAAERDQEQPPSPSRALTLLHPIVHITPAGMEEHLDELVGELARELAAEVVEAEDDIGPPTECGGLLGGAEGSLDLDVNLDSYLAGEEGAVSEEPGAVRLRSVGSAVQEPVVAAAAGASAGAAAAAAAAAEAPAPVGSGIPGRLDTWLRKRIGDAALAAAFAAEREMVDRDTLQEAAVYGRYAAAIYGSCPPDGPSKSSAWHLGGDGDGASADEVAAWRRRHGSSAPDPLLASILSSASKYTEHVVHVNTHNSTEGYLPYMVCLDKATRSVVIAIRGTFSAEDIVTDCLCEPLDVRDLLSRDVATAEAPDLAAPTISSAPPPPRPAPAPMSAVGLPAAANGPLATSDEAEVEATAAAAAAAAEAFNAAVNGLPSRDPVLVHAGIWAAADVIWEDLRELRLLDILLPPPSRSPPLNDHSPQLITIPARKGIPTTNDAATAAAAAAAAGPPTAAAAGIAVANTHAVHSRSGTNISTIRSIARLSSVSTQQHSSGPESHPRQDPPQRVSRLRSAQPSAQPSAQREAQQSQVPPQRQRYTASSAPPHRSGPFAAAPLPHQRQSQRRRPSSMDEDRAAALGILTTQLAPPPPAAYGASGGAAAADPWPTNGLTSFDASGPSHGVMAPHLPRLISAERQATMPHEGGLGALLLRRQQRLPPPPPPAAALLPSLVLSYHPPARSISTSLGSRGAAGSHREFLPSALRRGKSSAADAVRRGGGGGGKSSGRSSGEDAGEDNDNDPRAPLLPSSPSLATGLAAISYSPVETPLQAARPHPSSANVRYSGDFGFTPRRADNRPSSLGGACPSRFATYTATEQSPGSPSPPPPAAARRPFQPTPPSLPRHSSVAAVDGGSRGVAALTPTSPPAASCCAGGPSPPGLWAAGGLGALKEKVSPTGSAAAERSTSGAFFGVGRAVLELFRAVTALAPSAARQLQPPQQPKQQQTQQQEHQQTQQRRQSRVGWLGVLGSSPRSASEGGASQPYMTLPHTQSEAEGPAGGAGLFHLHGRRWRSMGGAGGDGNGGVDSGRAEGWSASGSQHYHPRACTDLEAAAPPTAPLSLGETDEGDGHDEKGEGEGAPSGGPGCSVPLRLPEVDCTGWRLVVTGHSLGAGAAALLALRLRSGLPHVEVRCWAFSPPGGGVWMTRWGRLDDAVR